MVSNKGLLCGLLGYQRTWQRKVEEEAVALSERAGQSRAQQNDKKRSHHSRNTQWQKHTRQRPLARVVLHHAFAFTHLANTAPERPNSVFPCLSDPWPRAAEAALAAALAPFFPPVAAARAALLRPVTCMCTQSHERAREDACAHNHTSVRVRMHVHTITRACA